MKILKKIFDPGGVPLQAMREAIVISNFYGRYLADKQIKRLAVESFAEVKIPSAHGKALEYFIDKLAISKEEFELLEKEAKTRAFVIGKDEQGIIVDRVKKSLDDSLAGGLNLQDWKKGIDQVFDEIGITELNPYYLDLIFRNATQDALNTGKFKLYEETDDDEFPSMQIHTAEDSRVRPGHAKLNGFTAPKNDPIWQTLRPPFDHGCRCTVSLVHKSEKIKNSRKKPNTKGKEFAFVN
jgi:SPP1 gp7 family putative phage head morphogenesis protein